MIQIAIKIGRIVAWLIVAFIFVTMLLYGFDAKYPDDHEKKGQSVLGDQQWLPSCEIPDRSARNAAFIGWGFTGIACTSFLFFTSFMGY